MLRIVIWTGSKGGTGKTTTTGNLGAAVVQLGYDVIVTGFDPQANLERLFGITDDQSRLRIEDLIEHGGDPHDALIPIAVPPATTGAFAKRKTMPPGKLALLPASRRLDDLDDYLAANDHRDLDDVLAALDGSADLLIVDTQGAESHFATAAVKAADALLFVGEPGDSEFVAVNRQMLEAQALHGAARPLMILGWLFTRTAANSVDARDYRQFFEKVSDPPLRIFETFIRQQGSVRQAARHGGPTIIVEPHSKVAADYRTVAQELVSLLGAMAQGAAR